MRQQSRHAHHRGGLAALLRRRHRLSHAIGRAGSLSVALLDRRWPDPMVARVDQRSGRRRTATRRPWARAVLRTARRCERAIPGTASHGSRALAAPPGTSACDCAPAEPEGRQAAWRQVIKASAGTTALVAGLAGSPDSSGSLGIRRAPPPDRDGSPRGRRPRGRSWRRRGNSKCLATPQ
jgi:hypothetical protein